VARPVERPGGATGAMRGRRRLLFWGRPSIGDLWHDLRAATSEIRPDWDLGRPGLRAAWDGGDLSRFHGWDRRSVKP